MNGSQVLNWNVNPGDDRASMPLFPMCANLALGVPLL